MRFGVNEVKMVDFVQRRERGIFVETKIQNVFNSVGEAYYGENDFQFSYCRYLRATLTFWNVNLQNAAPTALNVRISFLAHRK